MNLYHRVRILHSYPQSRLFRSENKCLRGKVLRILRGAGPSGLPTLTIAERMVERTPGITGLVDRLEAKGLVIREIPRHDRRLVYCRIAKKGLDLLKLLDGPIEAGNRNAFSGLTSKELQQFILLLNQARRPHED